MPNFLRDFSSCSADLKVIALRPALRAALVKIVLSSINKRFSGGMFMRFAVNS